MIQSLNTPEPAADTRTDRKQNCADTHVESPAKNASSGACSPRAPRSTATDGMISDVPPPVYLPMLAESGAGRVKGEWGPGQRAVT